MVKVSRRVANSCRGVTAVVLLCYSLSVMGQSAAAQNEEHAPAARMPVGRADWYYQLGGGQPVLNFSDGARVRNFDLFKGGAQWGFNACDFDLKRNIQAQINDVRRNLYALEQDIVHSARNLLRLSALSVIQRANPGLYDLLTRSIADAQVGFRVAVKNCEQMRQDVANGDNPLDGWIRLAAYARWTKAGRDSDVLSIDRQNRENPGSSGVPWVDGKYAGGAGQAPIQITADVIGAGYRFWQGSEQNDGAFSDQYDRLKTLWPAEQDAATWAREVLGETRIRFCRDCERFQSIPAQGLQPELARGRKRYVALLKKLVQSTGHPAQSDLAQLSANGMGTGIGMSVIQALKNEPLANRDILIGRLASEIALSDALEKALITRQLLYAGAAGLHIANNGEAQKSISALRERLESEMNNVLYEDRVRREVLTSSARFLLARSNNALVEAPGRKRSSIGSGWSNKSSTVPPVVP